MPNSAFYRDQDSGSGNRSIWNLLSLVPSVAKNYYSGKQHSGTLTPAAQDPWTRSSGMAGSALGIPKPGSLEDIMQTLEDLQNPDRYAPNQSLLEQQARAQASAQYDPVSAQIRAALNAAQGRADRNTKTLGNMYGSLSNSLMQDVAPIQQQFQGTKDKTAHQYDTLKNEINTQYDESQAEQEALMRRLNIEAAAPDALAGQVKDRNYFLANAATEGQTQQSALTQEESGAVDYTQRGSQIARMEGTNRQSDLMAQLQDYLNQGESQIAANESAKNQSYLAALSGLQQSSSSDALSRSQRDFENYIRVLQLSRELSKQPEVGPVKSIGDVAGKAMSMGLDADGTQRIQNIFMSALNDPLVMNGINPATGSSVTAEGLTSRIREIGSSQGLSGPELNILQQIASEYFGRR